MKVIDIILAAGPLSDAIVQIAANENNTVSILTRNNGFLLHMNGKRIVFEAEINMQITEHRERILAALLTYNAVWQDTGMIRMALTGNGPNAYPMLIADILIDETFTGPNVAALIEDLDAKIEIWRDIIASGADDGSGMMRDQNSVRV